MKAWFTLLFSGADNLTPAIGRVLGALLFINALAVLPTFILGVAFAEHVKFADLIAMLPQVGAYIGLVVGSIVVLIRVTNPTEPKP